MSYCHLLSFAFILICFGCSAVLSQGPEFVFSTQEYDLLEGITNIYAVYYLREAVKNPGMTVSCMLRSNNTILNADSCVYYKEEGEINLCLSCVAFNVSLLDYSSTRENKTTKVTAEKQPVSSLKDIAFSLVSTKNAFSAVKLKQEEPPYKFALNWEFYNTINGDVPVLVDSGSEGFFFKSASDVDNWFFSILQDQFNGTWATLSYGESQSPRDGSLSLQLYLRSTNSTLVSETESNSEQSSGQKVTQRKRKASPIFYESVVNESGIVLTAQEVQLNSSESQVQLPGVLSRRLNRRSNESECKNATETRNTAINGTFNIAMQAAQELGNRTWREFTSLFALSKSSVQKNLKAQGSPENSTANWDWTKATMTIPEAVNDYNDTEDAAFAYDGESIIICYSGQNQSASLLSQCTIITSNITNSAFSINAFRKANYFILTSIFYFLL